ncbi:MAG: hypothetical protein QXX30_00320 [Candidatus Aenigmatarchaeota archaeon]
MGLEVRKMAIRVKRIWKLFKILVKVFPILLNAKDIRAISIKVRGVNPFVNILVTPDYVYIKNKGIIENPEA